MSSFDLPQFGIPGMQGMTMGRPNTRFGQSPLGAPAMRPGMPTGGTEGSIQSGVLGNVVAATAAGMSPVAQNPALSGLAAPMNPMHIDPSIAPNMMGGLGQAAGGIDPSYAQAALAYQQMQAQGGIQPDMGNTAAMQDMPQQSLLQHGYGHAKNFVQENGLGGILKDRAVEFAAGAIAGKKFEDNFLEQAAKGYKEVEEEMGGTKIGEAMNKARGEFGNLFKGGKMNASSVSAMAGTAGTIAGMFGGPYGQAAGAALGAVSMGAGLLADNKKDPK